MRVELLGSKARELEKELAELLGWQDLYWEQSDKNDYNGSPKYASWHGFHPDMYPKGWRGRPIPSWTQCDGAVFQLAMRHGVTIKMCDEIKEPRYSQDHTMTRLRVVKAVIRKLKTSKKGI